MSRVFGEPRDHLSSETDAHSDAAGLLRGGPVTIRFDRRAFIVWWGADSSGTDLLAVDRGRLRTWATIEDCLNEMTRKATSADRPATDTPGDEWLLNFEPIQEWLGGRRIALDYRSALDLWNFAGDVTATLRTPKFDRGSVADECYSKLAAACVPWAFDRVQYRPRWTAREYRQLRHVLGESVRLLRAKL